MAEVQTQWVKEDGKWCQKQLNTKPTLPTRPVQSTKAPTLPPRNSRLSGEQTAPRPLIKSSPTTFRRPSDDSSINSRRTSEVILSRRDSNESINSTATAETSLSALSNGTSIGSRPERYAIRAPEYDPATLPALPPRKSKEEKEAEARAARYPLKSAKSTTSVPRTSEPARPSPPPRPQTRVPPTLPGRGNVPEEPRETKEIVAPALPERPKADARRQSVQQSNTDQDITPALPQRTLAQPPKRSALSLGFSNASPDPPARPATRPGSDAPVKPALRPAHVATNGTPPPVPTSSRPDLNALQASKPKLNGTTASHAPSSASGCLYCRDFSAPDNHAARFPRESLPSLDIGWLSQQLVAPFTSATDKARVIFTWLHHNVAYDVVAFFGNNVQSSTPNSTLASGLAVCEGYAALYAALAIKAGLEAVVVSGGCKGYGHSQIGPCDPIPSFNSDHAWNAVKLDDGQWKLIDPCWGAGIVNGAGKPYTKRFAEQHFIMSNDLFGLSHYPTDTSKQYRNDGRVMGWEEFCRGSKTGGGATIYGGFTWEAGISEASMRPMNDTVVLSQQGPTVRFSFQTVCPHWETVNKSKGQYVFLMHIQGMDGTPRSHVSFKKADGIWWLDVPVKELGRPGQTVMICAVREVRGRDGRGYTIAEFDKEIGRVAMSFGGLAVWTMA